MLARLLALSLFFYSTSTSFPMSMKEAVASIGSHTNMMPRQGGFTLPLVKTEGARTVIYRLIYLKRPIPNEATTITPPQFIASYDLTRGKFLSVARFDLRLPDLPAEPWKADLPRWDNPREIVPEFERIWKLYDALIPAFEKRHQPGAGDRVKSEAREYLRYFKRHVELPLLPFYEFYSGEFLTFVRAAAD